MRGSVQAKRCSQPDIADLDVENKRLRMARKGGRLSNWLHFQSGSARLLPRLIGDREAGADPPFFLADRRPAPARAPPP